MTTHDASSPLPDSAEGWFARLNSGDAGSADRTAFEAWLELSPENRRAYARVRRLWEAAPSMNALQAAGVDLSGTAGPLQDRRRVRPVVYQLAAVLTLALGLGIFWTVTQETAAPGTYQADLGERVAVTLEDDTTIDLNTETVIEVESSRELREVRLVRGEALFSVSADPERPFIVHTGSGATVRVVGTKFSVREEAGRTLVATLEGSVQVYRRPPDATEPVSPLMLSRGQVAACPDGGEPALVDSVDVEQLTAWTRGKLVFRDTELANAVNELNRYRQDKIRIADPELRTLRIGGVFNIDRGYELVRQLENAGLLRTVEAIDGSVYLYGR